MEARFYKKLDNNRVQCSLCPHNCVIADGKTGKCHVRKNSGGILQAESYGILSAVNIDPVEKKPLFHFHPGKNVLSLGGFGCSFSCNCCQNHSISQSGVNFQEALLISVSDIIEKALQINNNIGIAFTYNEPTVWFEFMLEIAKQSHKVGLKNILVSNGYINSEPLNELLDHIDACNIDLKVFNHEAHKNFTGGNLGDVLATLVRIKERNIHLEITHLLIPGLNDNKEDFEKMLDWISENLGKDVPLHISRYFPKFLAHADPTPFKTIHDYAFKADSKLFHIYSGNLNQNFMQSTFCPNCGEEVIIRNIYNVNSIRLKTDGTCASCGYNLIII